MPAQFLRSLISFLSFAHIGRVPRQMPVLPCQFTVGTWRWLFQGRQREGTIRLDWRIARDVSQADCDGRLPHPTRTESTRRVCSRTASQQAMFGSCCAPTKRFTFSMSAPSRKKSKCEAAKLSAVSGRRGINWFRRIAYVLLLCWRRRTNC